jgi:hypothetical protein
MENNGVTEPRKDIKGKRRVTFADTTELEANKKPTNPDEQENNGITEPRKNSKGKRRVTFADTNELQVNKKPVDPDEQVWVEVSPSGSVQVKTPTRAATASDGTQPTPRRITYSGWPQVDHSRTFKLTVGQAEFLRSHSARGLSPAEITEWYKQQGIEPPVAQPAPAHLRLASGPVTAENVHDSPYVDGYPHRNNSNGDPGPSTAAVIAARRATTHVRILDLDAAPVSWIR